MRRLLAPLLCAVLLSACPDANATPIRLLSVAVSCSDGGACYVKGAFTVPSQADGKGAIDAILTAKKQGTDSVGHTLAITVRRDSFAFTPPAVGQKVTGQFCVVAKRRALVSAAACRTWSYTREDSPPAPIILDSVMVGLERLMDEGVVFQFTALSREGSDDCPLAYCTHPDLRADVWYYCPAPETNPACRDLLIHDTYPHGLAARNRALVEHVWRQRHAPVYSLGDLWDRTT